MEKKTFTSLAYHNTTARFNSYYLAREKIIEVENAIYKDKKDNFGRVLPVYPATEIKTIAAAEPKLVEAIKKASISIQYHKNSKWVDNCYILVGRSRFYKQDYENALVAFKYVNTISDNDNDKAEALAWLARCYIAIDQNEFAMGVLNHSKKLELTKKNLELLALVESELYQKIGYIKSLSKNIEIAANNATNKRNRGRSNFIAGQVFQEIGNDDKAYDHYKKCLKTNPEYEMEFYAKLNMAQVTGFSDAKDINKIKRYFKKLLRDVKNVDYKDKIYYEMGKFEFKQEKIPQTIDYLNLSIQSSTKNPNQKAYSYLMLGEIHYDNIMNFRKAAKYYDSTMMFLSKSEPNYIGTNKRAKILKEFVQQLEIIEKQDSLLFLAEMDTSKLNDYVDAVIKKNEIARIKREAMIKLALEKKSKQLDDDSPDILATGGNTWYFYNPASISEGKLEFVQYWGERKLTDHWRRSAKNQAEDFDDENEDSTVVSSGSNQVKNNIITETEEERLIRLRNEFIAKIPKNELGIVASHKLLKKAFYTLGGIYHLKLEELSKANDTYEELLKRYPEYKKKIQVYYILYLVNKDINKAKSDYYKNLVKSNYSNSMYAKLIDDPEYLTKNWHLNKQAELMYSNGYDLYEAGKNYQSIAMCDSIKKVYPENYIFDKIDLLIILNVSKTQGILEYQKQLEAYIKKYKASPLKNTAIAYLQECQNFIKREVYGENTVASGDSAIQIYDSDIEEKQFFVIAIPQDKGLVINDILVNLSDHNEGTSFSLNLEVSHLIFNKDYYFITTKSFQSKQIANNYRDRINMQRILENDKVDFSTFLITPSNYSKLYKTKALEEYKTFFRNTYF